MRHWVPALLLLAVTAFAGRPVYVCLMESRVAAAPVAHCHTPKPACDHCGKHEAPVKPATDCMVDAGSPVAPTLVASTVPVNVATVIGELVAPRVLVVSARTAVPAATRFESPPHSIDILRI